MSQTPTPLTRALSMVGDMVGRLKFATQAGLSFGGHRDTYQAFGYPKCAITYAQYYALYKRGDIATRIIEAYPQALWQTPPRLSEDDDPDTTTAFEAAYPVLYTELAVWPNILKVHTLAQIGHYAAVWLTSEGEPTTPATGAPITALIPLGEASVQIASTDTNPNSPRFCLPLTYNINLTGWSGIVHHSRILHVVARSLDSRLYGSPLLERTFNRLLDYEKVVGAGSEAAFRNMDRDIVFNKEDQAEIGNDDRADFEDQLDAYEHRLQRYILTNGVTPTPLSGDTQNFDSNTNMLLQIISGATGIPTRKLLGSEQGKLAGTEDGNTWKDNVRQEATYFGEPLIRDLNSHFVATGQLPDVSYDIKWPPMSKPTPEELARTAVQYAKANQSQAKAGGELIITGAEIRKDVLGKQPLEDVDQPVTVATRAAANNPESQAVVNAASDNESDYDNVVMGAWLDSVGDVIDADVIMVSINAALASDLPVITASTMSDSALAVQTIYRDRGSYRAAATSVRNAEFNLEFGVNDPVATAWAESRVADLVTEIGPDTLDTIRVTIARGQAAGLTTAQQAKELQTVIGLRSDQLDAVDALEGRLRDALPGSTVHAGDRAIRIPASGSTDAFVTRQRTTYATTLRNERALTIARTETMRAANQGQLELWQKAVNAGELPPDIQRVWLANTERHVDMEGRPTPLGQPFVTLEGLPLEPGQEPNCGCTQGLV